MDKNVYLGDGVYAEFDGYGVWLRTGDHRDALCDNKIYLDPNVMEKLYSVIRRMDESIREARSV